MRMSKDRVLFRLAPRYYTRASGNAGMDRNTCSEVLGFAFGRPCWASCGSWFDVMEKCPSGIAILCRPSQFARFIIRRFEIGNCINGVRDLSPQLLVPETLYSRVSAETGRSMNDVCAVAMALGVSNTEREYKVGEMVMDVSRNFGANNAG